MEQCSLLGFLADFYHNQFQAVLLKSGCLLENSGLKSKKMRQICTSSNERSSFILI